MGVAQSDIGNIRAYFKWLNDVYRRSYDHYALVIRQADAEAQTEQAWLDFASGVGIGSAVGLIGEAAIAGRSAEKALESVVELGSEFVEGGISSRLKFDVPRPTVGAEFAPALKEVQSLKRLDELNATILPMAVKGLQSYADPIVQAERLSAELRVAEAGGERRISDADIQSMNLKLMRFELASWLFDRDVDATALRFEALRKSYTGKQPPTDQRCEQDIWIPWIAQQSGEATRNVFITPVLSRPVLANHLVDVGLAARGGPGGRLNADISNWRRIRPEEVASLREPHQQLILGARAEQGALPAHWRSLFLF